jgi:hypothetical protein
MSVLFEPAIAHLGEAKHAIDDPDRMLDLGPYLRLGAVFRPLHLIHDAAMAIAAVDKVLRSQGVPAETIGWLRRPIARRKELQASRRDR